MKNISIPNIDYFKVLDAYTGEMTYGCDQEWFSTEWQRRAGCAPCVACNILLYLNRARTGDEGTPVQKKFCEEFMDEIWTYVTPTERGMPSTEMFCDDVRSYGEAKRDEIECVSFDIPNDAADRPTAGEVSTFLEESLANDLPVAFLNLCNGSEKNLPEWHWVTIVSMKQETRDSHIFIVIVDEGALKTIDLSLWLDTTSNGGGFVRFSYASASDKYAGSVYGEASTRHNGTIHLISGSGDLLLGVCLDEQS
ncbi:MAG: hypothetical protein LBI74_05060 [Synergistaceae bacterium]|jgi:hypothetical protein|nr:hypothetical protein [Synergistaceae bacterium]